MAVFSYGAKILYPNGSSRADSTKKMHLTKKMLSGTMKIYQAAVSFLINAADRHYEEIKDMLSRQAVNYIEHLIHNTKGNRAVYGFDEKFPQFPSYFRRAVIMDAAGEVKSFHTRLSDYENRRHAAISSGQKFQEKPPVLNRKPYAMPTFYKGNMYLPPEDGRNEVKLKVYTGKGWEYASFQLRKQDVKYIQKFRESHGGKLKNPVLEYRYGRFHLRYGVDLPASKLPKEKPVSDRAVMAVDLGINSDAACSVMKGDGTIAAREFINLAGEKASLYTLLNRKKKLQRMSGNWKFAPLKKITAKVNGVNDSLMNQVVHRIVELAVRYGVDTAVFEHLDFRGGSYGELVHYWRKKGVFHKACVNLHLYGIRYATVNPKNTSVLAFDGSGKVLRDKGNHALCTFKSGKQYNCDLGASYNIGARYFIRETLRSMGEKEKQDAVERFHIPSSLQRTYADFKRMAAAI